MASLRFEGVTKRFDGAVAVDNLDLEVHDGELLVLLGPSGCGKTTALRMVAGLEDVSAGHIYIGDRIVNDVEPKDRDIAMVFQSYALYPHLTVAKNIEFPLRQRNADKIDRVRMVNEAAATLGLTAFLDRRPGQLSGGQRQRVALARAIVRSPQAFLMDEPLSNLDATLRTQTRADIVTLQQRLRTTTLYVTHDQVEAMTMGHRIAVMSAGVLQQVAVPQEIYERPANVFVAGFIGSPGMNLLNGTLDPTMGTRAVRVETGTIPVPARVAADRGMEVVVGCRPEALTIDSAGSFTATVSIVELLGADVHVVCRVGDARLVVRQDLLQPRPELGQEVRIRVEPDGVHVFDAESGERLADRALDARPRLRTDSETNASERARWNDEAWVAAWQKREVVTASMTPTLLEHAPVSAGERVLEIGSGTGDLAVTLAGRVGPGGSVVGVDLSRRFVELSREKAARAGVGAVSFVVADAQTATLDGPLFDVVISQFGVMFFDDPSRAFSNIAKHMTHGARLAFICWRGADVNPWCVSSVLAPYLPASARPDPDGPGPFAFGDADHVRAILAEAGFVDVLQTAYARSAVVGRDALISDASLTATIAESDLAKAMVAVEEYLDRFRVGENQFEIPLAFQVFVARRP